MMLGIYQGKFQGRLNSGTARISVLFPYHSHSRIPLKCGNGTGNLWEKGSSHSGVNCAPVPQKTLAEQSHSLVGDVLLMVEYPTETDIGKSFQNSHSYNNKNHQKSSVHVGLSYLPLASYCPYPIVDTELSTRKSHSATSPMTRR